MSKPASSTGLAGRGAYSAIILASTITGLHFLSLTFSRPIFPLLASDMGASEAMIGLLTSLSYVLPLFIALPAGLLIERWGIKALAVAGSVSLVLGNIAYALARGFALLACARVLNGLAQVVVLVALQTYIAELSRGGQQDRNFSTIYFFTGIGQLAGPLAGGAIAGWFGMRPSFWTAAGLAVVPLALCIVVPEVEAVRAAEAGRGASPAPLARRSRRPAGRLDPAAILGLLRLPGVQLGVGASLVMLVADGARESFFPLYAAAAGMDEVAVGALLSLNALFSILIQPFATRLAATWGRGKTLTLAMLVGVLGHGSVPFARTFGTLAVSSAVSGISLGVNQPPSMACVAEASPPNQRAMAMALRLTGNRVGLLLSPVLAGLVVTAWGLAAYFYAAAALLVGGGALMSWLGKRCELADGRPRGAAEET